MCKIEYVLVVKHSALSLGSLRRAMCQYGTVTDFKLISSVIETTKRNMGTVSIVFVTFQLVSVVSSSTVNITPN